MSAEKNWKPLELVKVTADYLSGKGVPTARLDAEILLCKALGLEKRIELYAGFEREIPPDRLVRYREMVKRRAGREPVSRILGEREFMGLRMEVNASVLSPRPETELLVETALAVVKPRPHPVAADETAADEENGDGDLMPEALEKILDSYGEDADGDDIDAEAAEAHREPAMTLRQAARSGAWRKTVEARLADARAAEERTEGGAGRDGRARVLDLGTGSGCVAVALAAMSPSTAVTAGDVSPEALATARRNAEAAGVADRIDFRLGSWFAVCREGERFDVIVSNPPYLVEGDPDIWPEVSGYDPALALYGGPDGLDAYRAIAAAAGERLLPGGRLYLEVGAGQASAVASMLRDNGFGGIETIKDYAGVERVVGGVWK